MDDDTAPSAKRSRLSMACNECRRRKVKCDTDHPKCRNCRLRNDICNTTDPKRPDVVITREWVDQPDVHQRHPSVSQTEPRPRFFPAQSPRSSSVSMPPRPPINQSPRSNAPSAARSENKGISPAQQPYEMAFNTDSSTDRIKMMGGSSSQCLMKSLDAYLESAQIPPLGGNFRHGMRQAEEMEIPISGSLPRLPETSRLNTYVTTFFEKIHRLYPLFDIDQVKTTINQLACLPDFNSLHQDQVPWLVIAYLIVSLGSDEKARKLTDEGTKYIIAAARLVGNVLLVPYLPAVQALLLFAITYRGRNKDGAGWQTLGMAIRIAYTLGLHRYSSKNPSSQHAVQNKLKQLFHARIWAICCSLEKMMQLESGRPTMIQDVDCDQMMGSEQNYGGNDFLQWHMGLAQHQGLISYHIYGHKPGDRPAQQILSDTGSLDRSLLSWTREIPDEFRPGNDLFCSDKDFHIAALLSMQYFQTIIALHRAALISPAANFISEVAKHSFDDSARLRLQAGEAICVNSARSIARLGIELSDRNCLSRLSSGGPQLLACIVLGISLMKNPGGRIMAADLELLKACANQTADLFLQTGHNDLFAKGIISIYEQVRLHITRKSRQNTPPDATNQPNIPAQPPNNPNQAAAPIYKPPEGPNQSIYQQQAEPGSNHPIFPENSIQSDVVGMNISPQVLGTGPNNVVYSDALPFDGWNVQELWTWMGDLDGYDEYIYDGSYQGNGSL